MADNIAYGQVVLMHSQGRPKLAVNLTPRVKVAVNRFQANNTIYVHVASRNKTISITYEEFEELCASKVNLDGKLHLLPEQHSQPLQQQQNPQLQQQSQSLQQQQGTPPLHQGQPLQHQGQHYQQQDQPIQQPIQHQQQQQQQFFWEDSQFF